MTKYKLVLDHIGKFKNCHFDLNDVTIFHGPNEAGKTTIIDALIHCLANSRKNQYLYSCILEARYGDKISCRLKRNDNNEEVTKIDHDLVKNLLVIRASSLDLEFSNKSREATWVGDVRNKLFTGGVNPQTIVDSINMMEKKTKNSGSPLFEHKKLEEDISNLRDCLTSTKTQIQAQASKIKEQEDLTREEEELNQKIGNFGAEIKTNSSKLARLKKLLERYDVTVIQGKISEKEALKDKLATGTYYSEENYSNIKASEDTLQKIVHQRELLEEDHKLKMSAFLKAKDERKKFQDSFENSKVNHELAKRTQLRLEEMVSLNETQKAQVHANVEKSKGPLFIGLMLIVLVGAVLIALGTPMNFLGLFLIAGAVWLLWKASQNTPPQSVEINAPSSSIDFKAEIRFFNQQYKILPGCPDTNYVQAIDFLREIIDSFTASTNTLRQLIVNLQNIEIEVDQINTSIIHLDHQINKVNTNLKSLLPAGLKRSEEFYKLIQERISDASRLKTLEEELNSAANKLGLDPKVELSQYLSHKIIEKNNDHIAHEEFNQRDLNLLEHEIIKKTEEKDELLKMAGEVGKKLIGTNKEIQLTLNRLSVEQVKIEKEICLKEEACNKKMLEMDSMRLLKAIVSEIAVDATEKFSVLSESINKYLSVILDKNSNIKLTGFTNLDDVQCLDHYDHVREANQLSSGTKDALVLAARLALLEKVDLQKDAFLILDDPFVLMDYERQNKAIKALKKFYDDTKMAIVVFTKDQTVRDMVKAQFGGADTVELHR